MAELHVSDFSQDPKKIVIDLINHDNVGANMTSELLEFGLPSVSVGGEGGNTELEVNAVEGSGYKGGVVVNYNRLNIQDFVPIMVGSELTLPVGDATRFADLIGEINVALGINLTADDYVDGDIGAWEGRPNETKTILIPMNADSLVFIGSLSLTVASEDIDLAEVITTLILSGLNLPEAPEVDLTTEMTGPLNGFGPRV